MCSIKEYNMENRNMDISIKSTVTSHQMHKKGAILWFSVYCNMRKILTTS